MHIVLYYSELLKPMEFTPPPDLPQHQPDLPSETPDAALPDLGSDVLGDQPDEAVPDMTAPDSRRPADTNDTFNETTAADKPAETADYPNAAAEAEATPEEAAAGETHTLPSREALKATLAERSTDTEAETKETTRVGGAEVRERVAPDEHPAPPKDQHTYAEGADMRGLDPAVVDEKYRQDVARSRDSMEFEGARQPNEQELDALGRFGEGMAKIGDEIGVDLRSRLTDPKHIHIFRDVAQYREAVAQVAAGSEMSRGVTRPHAGILVVEKVNPLDNVYGIMHEETHDLSRRIVTPHIEIAPDGSAKVDAAKSGIDVGYTHMSGKGAGATNESITDMATHRGMANGGLPRIIPGYTVSSLLMSGIVHDTAANLNVHPQQVENELTKGMVSPDTTGIDMVRRALGDRAVGALLNTPANLQTVPAAYAAQQIGSPTAEKALWGREAGAPTDWFTWR